MRLRNLAASRPYLSSASQLPIWMKKLTHSTSHHAEAINLCHIEYIAAKQSSKSLSHCFNSKEKQKTLLRLNVRPKYLSKKLQFQVEQQWKSPRRKKNNNQLTPNAGDLKKRSHELRRLRSFAFATPHGVYRFSQHNYILSSRWRYKLAKEKYCNCNYSAFIHEFGHDSCDEKPIGLKMKSVRAGRTDDDAA